MGLAARVEVYAAALTGDRLAAMLLVAAMRSPDPGLTDYRGVLRVAGAEPWLAAVLFGDRAPRADPLPEALVRRARGQRQLADAFAGRWEPARGPVH